MNRNRVGHSSKKMAITSKIKTKALQCSTPERYQSDSPSRDSDSICDSEAASPVPFLCTQDGLEGETDVVWNYYTPKCENNSKHNSRNTTPLSTRPKRIIKPKVVEKIIPKRRNIRPTQKNTQLLQDLKELNENIHKFIDKPMKPENCRDFSGSEDDVCSSSDNSPKTGLKSNSRCLRKNLFTSKLNKPEPEPALESDDSMNELLIAATQVVEENISAFEGPANINKKPIKSVLKIDENSIDAILNTINFDSPILKAKKCESPRLCNDSFDNLVGGLNDSALDRLTQISTKKDTPQRSMRPINKDWTIKEITLCESPTSIIFGRHCSMPESPVLNNATKPSTSGMSFGRHSSLPHDNQGAGSVSPMKCTPDEIQRKRKQARDKLLAKRLLPFTSSQQPQPIFKENIENEVVPNKKFQPKIPTTNALKVPMTRANSLPVNESNNINVPTIKQNNNKNLDLRQLIEKKRQEALMKLRKRHPSCKIP